MNKGPNGSTILENQPNFRSLEGIISPDGRRFRRNMVYRSGGLSNLNREEVRILEEMGLLTVIDFRSDRELKSYPTVAVSTVKNSYRLVIEDIAREEAELLLSKNDAKGMDSVLVKDYRRMVKHDSGTFAAFIKVLQEENGFPLVYHCAAGKDRTGLATFFFLSALGIDREVIMQDYFMSNIRLKSFAQKFVDKLSEKGYNGEIVRPMMEVRPEYILAALEEIDEVYGGMEEYVTRVLGADRELLKNKFLE